MGGCLLDGNGGVTEGGRAAGSVPRGHGREEAEEVAAETVAGDDVRGVAVGVPGSCVVPIDVSVSEL